MSKIILSAKNLSYEPMKPLPRAKSSNQLIIETAAGVVGLVGGWAGSMLYIYFKYVK